MVRFIKISLTVVIPQHAYSITLQLVLCELTCSRTTEFIGGRQAPSTKANTGRNMGLPYDAQNASVWVDTYASEFSRDMEPSVEGGDRVWKVATSCVQMYVLVQPSNSAVGMCAYSLCLGQVQSGAAVH